MPSQKAQFAHANVKSGNFSPLFSNAREKNGSASFFPSHLKTGRKTLLDARGTKLLFKINNKKLYFIGFGICIPVSHIYIVHCTTVHFYQFLIKITEWEQTAKQTAAKRQAHHAHLLLCTSPLSLYIIPTHSFI
jgi:hypothetical protein